jgi:hypothetical protein
VSGPWNPSFPLTRREITCLELAASESGFYPGVQADVGGKHMRRLFKRRYVSEYLPSNPVHKVRAVATEAGLRALREAQGK